MAGMNDTLLRWIWGTSDARELGFEQTLRGIREGRRNDLYVGLAISALAYLQRTKPRKTLIHRQEVPEGAAIVINHKKSGEQRLEIIRPKKRKRGS